jgi:hypothetical protein
MSGIHIMWEKFKLWLRVIVFGAMALYVLIVVTLNWGLVLEGKLRLIFTEFDHPRVLVVLIVTAVLSIFGWWLFRTIFKTVRQFRSGRERSRTTKLEREVAEMKAKAGMLQTRESPAATVASGTVTASAPLPPRAADDTLT